MRSYKISIIVSRFNEFITDRLLQGCLLQLKNSGLKKEQWTIHYVPGALELPVAALTSALRKDIDGVICLGAVIRGETYHFDLVADQCARGIMEVSLVTGKPVIFGVLTTDNDKQANERSMIDGGDNKGGDAALAVLQMIETLAQMKSKRKS